MSGWDRKDLYVLLVQAALLMSASSLVVVGGYGSRGELLAFQVGERINARAIAHDERFVDARNGGEIEGLHIEPARGRGGEWARADIADLDVAGSNGGEDFGAGIEAAEVDLRSRRFFKLAVGDRDRRRQRIRLIAHDYGFLDVCAAPVMSANAPSAVAKEFCEETFSFTFD